MEHGNLLHPKIITVAVRGFLSLIWMVNFQLELPADAGRGSTGAAVGGWLPVCPHFCTGELKIFRIM